MSSVVLHAKNAVGSSSGDFSNTGVVLPANLRAYVRVRDFQYIMLPNLPWYGKFAVD